MLRKLLLPVVLLAIEPTLAHAAVKTKVVTYEYEGVKLKGFLAWDDAAEESAGILVVHEWWGLNAYARAGPSS